MAQNYTIVTTDVVVIRDDGSMIEVTYHPMRGNVEINMVERHMIELDNPDQILALINLLQIAHKDMTDE